MSHLLINPQNLVLFAGIHSVSRVDLRALSLRLLRRCGARIFHNHLKTAYFSPQGLECPTPGNVVVTGAGLDGLTVDEA